MLPLATPSTDADDLSGAINPASRENGPPSIGADTLSTVATGNTSTQPQRSSQAGGHQWEPFKVLPVATLRTANHHTVFTGGDGYRLLPLATPSTADCQAVFTGADG
ncbi:hypothetical protein [Pseudomonas sp.]|uniref:hypothetical protein n=1 Tax=Pseudomonas sp. TaxID=306 RepID=UPI0028AFE2F8|nr:hypothetical protein [Pseudomonas sp.]